MHPRVSFRYLEPEDKQDYLFLVSEFGDTTLSDSLWKTFIDEYEDSTKEIWIGEVTDKTHGRIVVCTASLIHDFKAHNRLGVSIYIADFSVHQKYRRLGIGSNLMQHLLNQARAIGAFEMYINSELPKEFLDKFKFENGRLLTNAIYSYEVDDSHP